MKAWMSATSRSSDSYSSGSEGRSTTSFRKRLFCGEYGTRRREGSRVMVFSLRHFSSSHTTKADSRSAGRYTISTSPPEGRTAETVGIERGLLRSSFGVPGFVIVRSEALEHIQRLHETQMLNGF